MALPASGPISSSQVATEFSVSQTNISLSNLGTQLSTPITAGQPVELANDFYGQSASTCTAFTSTSESSKNPCEGEPESTLYHNGSGSYPVAGDNVYTDSGCSTALSPGDYKMANGKVMNVTTGGLVNSTTDC